MVELVADTWGIALSRHVESIFDSLSSWGGLYIFQPEITPLSRSGRPAVETCHAGGGGGSQMGSIEAGCTTP